MIATNSRRYWKKRAIGLVLGLAGVVSLAILANLAWTEFGEKRTLVVAPHRLLRGAWQRPVPLRRILRREGIRTLLTLTAINRDDPKYIEQERVVREEGVEWIIVPMRGSTATPEQLAIAADIATDPRRQPVFFHCVAGHHRSNLVQAAIRIRGEHWPDSKAWAELEAVPWTRPEATPDVQDRALIEQFARVQGSIPQTQPKQVRELTHAFSRQTGGEMDLSRADAGRSSAPDLDRLD